LEQGRLITLGNFERALPHKTGYFSARVNTVCSTTAMNTDPRPPIPTPPRLYTDPDATRGLSMQTRGLKSAVSPRGIFLKRKGDGGQGQNRTADTRIFSPAHWRVASNEVEEF